MQAYSLGGRELKPIGVRCFPEVRPFPVQRVWNNFHQLCDLKLSAGEEAGYKKWESAK